MPVRRHPKRPLWEVATLTGGLGPLILSVPGRCLECWSCVRYCPANAIRIADGCTQIIEEKCVACGLCVSECGNCGHDVRDDTGRVRELLSSGRPVVCVLATEFVAALHPMPTGEIESAVESLGFYAVESTLLGEELVAMAYERQHSRECSMPILRSTCPVTTSWVLRFHPKLTQALAPIVPPYVAQARLIKALYPEGTAVVYVSPCYARKDEFMDEDFGGAVDAVIDFVELKRMMSGSNPPPGATGAQVCGVRRPAPIKELSLTDGYPRATLVSHNLTSADVVVVRGLRALDRLLTAIEAGEAGPAIVDMLNCEGCVDGPAVNPGLSVFAKRNIDAAEREGRGRSTVSSRALLRYLPAIEVVRTLTAEPVHLPEPTDDQIVAILAEGEFAPSSTPDCGACGYETCVEHAIAIFQGNSTWEMCFPLQRKMLLRNAKALEESATLDPLTSLWNRRVFAERLEDEMARHARYGHKVSLMMMDIDAFKDVNDQFGHVAGDRVLAAVSDLLRDSLRTTDIASRYGGDEFALILPSVGKTEAFAAAEKLRTLIESMPVRVQRDGHEEDVDVRVSIGVASAGSATNDPIGLIEAADRALYQAKEAGRNQVRLAAG
jgi:diguanylate cyclase (GGDEF)-like protein